MQIFAIIATLFVIGSLVGWIIEVFFRRFFSRKKWMNPGFLTGPYLPIYGFGVIGLYALSEIFFSIEIESKLPQWALVIITILIIGAILIAIEFIAGLIFIKGLGLKLWDYSNQKGNTMGIICPLFDLLWTAAGAIYFFFIHPGLRDAIAWISIESNNVYYLFIGMVLGMMLVDAAYSIHLAKVVSKFAKSNKVVLKLSEIQEKVRESKLNNKNKKPVVSIPTITEFRAYLQNLFKLNQHSNKDTPEQNNDSSSTK